MSPAAFDKQLHQTNVLLKLTTLQEHDDFCDLIIRCGSKEIKVHRAVVAAQSDWFLKACAGGFKESKLEILELPDDDPEDIEATLNLCYKFEYTAAEHSPLTFDARMFAIGEKYLLESLQSYVADQLSKRLRESHSSDDFASAVYVAYISMSDPKNVIRECILATALDNCLHTFSASLSTNQWMLEVPSFMLDLLRAATTVGMLDPGAGAVICPSEGCQKLFNISWRLNMGQSVAKCTECKNSHVLSQAEWAKHRISLRNFLAKESSQVQR